MKVAASCSPSESKLISSGYHQGRGSLLGRIQADAYEPHSSIIDSTLKKFSKRATTSYRRRRLIVERRTRREHFAKVAQETLRTIAGGDPTESCSTQSYFELLPSSSGRADPSFSSILGSGSSEANAKPSSNKTSSSDLFPQIIRTRQATCFYPHQSAVLAGMNSAAESSMEILKGRYAASDLQPCDSTFPDLPIRSVDRIQTHIQFQSAPALTVAQSLHQSSVSTQDPRSVLGVLNCASPKRPGGAFLNGGDEQEEGIVRRSTLFDSLQNSKAGQQFYASHRVESDGSGLHDHAMLYSPGVLVFKDHTGVDLSSPFQVNVVSSVPVNAGTVRAKFSLNVDPSEIEEGIRSVMKERMTRALRLFALRGDRVLVLGAFGVGQSRNSVDTVAELWAELVGIRGAQFQNTFDRIVFALPGKHRDAFETAFYGRCLESELSTDS